MSAMRSLRRRSRFFSSRSNKKKRQSPPQMEMLEPRLLLSADSVLPGVTGALESGLISFVEEVQGFDEQLDFPTAIPGVLQIYRDTNDDEVLDDRDVHVPTEVTVSVDRNRNGVIDAFGVLDLDDGDKEDPQAVYEYIHEIGMGFFTPTTEQKLDAMDLDGDMAVDWGEAYRALFIGRISNALDAYPGAIGIDALEAYLNLVLDFTTEPPDLSSFFNIEVTGLSSKVGTTTFGHSFDISLTLTDNFTIDLGLEAEDLEIVLPPTEWTSSGERSDVPRAPEVLLSQTVSMPFSYYFRTSDAPLMVDHFNFATETISFSIDANESLEDLIVNVGFLGTEAPAGSVFELNMDYEVQVIDPSSPVNLGFADEDPSVLLFSAGESDGVLEAANEPRASDFEEPGTWDYENDIVFTLTIGTQSYSPTSLVTVTADGNISLGDLIADVEGAVDTALGDPGLITVDDDGTGKLRLNLPTTNPSELGFGEQVQGTSFIEAASVSPQIGRTSLFLWDIQSFSFLLSVAGQVPELVTVNAFPATFVDPDASFPILNGDEYYELTKLDLISQVQTALTTAFGAGVVTASDGDADDKISLSTTGTLEITRMLTMEAVNNITHTEWTSATGEELFEAAADLGDDDLHIYLSLDVRPGLDFAPSGSPSLEIDVDPFDLSSSDVGTDDSGLERFDLPFNLNDFEQYLDFNVVGPGEVIGMLNQLISWLDRLPATEMLGGFRVAFAQAVLGDVLDLGDVVDDELLIDDLDDGIQAADAGGGKLLRFVDSPDDLAIVFGTAQELAARLNALGGGGVLTPTDGGTDGDLDDLVDYDEVKKHLLYQISLSHELSYVVGEQLATEMTVPVDFDEDYLNLDPLNTIYSASRVNLAAIGHFDAVLGIRLGQAKTIEPGTPLEELDTVSGQTVDETIKTELALTGAMDAAVFEGRLAADQEFTIRVTTGTGTVEETVTVEREDTDDNEEFIDLIDDINAALPVTLNTLVQAQMADRRIQLVAIHPSVLSFELVGSSEVTPYSLYGYSTVPLVMLSQISQLGLNEGSAWTVRTEALNPLYSGDMIDVWAGASFEISINGGSAIPFSVPEDGSNNTLSDLVDDLNAAIGGAGLGGQILATQSNGRIVFLGVHESVEAFRVTATGTNKLGFSSFIQGTSAAPSNGQLLADVSFDITVTEYGGIGPQVETRTITVEQAATELNNSLDDLIKDINHAIWSHAYLVGKIVAERGVGNTIVLRSVYTGGYGTFFRDFEASPGSNSGDLGFGATQASTASQVAGVSLRAERDVSSQFGRLTADANFTITLNDDPTGTLVTVDWGDTRINTSVDALITDINNAIDATGPTGLAGKIRAERFGNFRIVLRVIDESVGKFTLTVASPLDKAVTQLGFGTSQTAEAVLNIVAGRDAPAYVGPGEDAHFAVDIVGGAKAGSYDVTVDAFNAYTNHSIFDLVGDVRRGLRNAQGEVVIFAGSSVNTEAEILTIGSHPFATGDTVRYVNGGGTSIEGLSNGSTYYVIYVDPTSVQLASSIYNATHGNALDITAVGAGSSHQLIEQVRLDDVLVVSNDGGRLVFTAKANSDITDFSITADTADPAVTDLKLYSPEDYPADVPSFPPGAITFHANEWDLLIRTADGDIHPVSLDGIPTPPTIGGVMEAIYTQINDPGADATYYTPDDEVKVDIRINDAQTGLDLEDMTAGSALFQVDAVNGSGAAYSLGIFAADTNSVDDVADGLIEGENISILKLSDRLFFREVDSATPFLSADITLSLPDLDFDSIPDPIEMIANYGFVGVTLNGDLPTDMTGTVKMSLEDPALWNLGEEVKLADLLNGMSQDVNDDGVVDAFDLATALRFPTFWPELGGTFVLTPTIDPFTEANEITDEWGPAPEIYVTTNDQGNPFARALGSNRPFDPAAAVTPGSPTITFSHNHWFDTGDTVVYFDGPDGDSIGGLVDGNTYYVIEESPTEVKLEAEPGHGAIVLTSTGSGALHYLDGGFTPQAPDAFVSESQIGPLLNLGDITFEHFLPALQNLDAFLQAFAASPFLQDPLPMLGVSFNELVGIADRFHAAVVEMEQNQAASIQLVEQKLRESFGLPQSPSIFDPIFDLELVNNGDPDTDYSDMLRITLNLPKPFNMPLPIGIDLTGAITAPGVTGDISLLGAAGVQGAGSIDAKFTFGIDLDDLSRIVLFTEDALTGITGGITANSDNLAFNASLGQLGVYVKEGNANFNLDFGFLAGGAADATIPLNASATDSFTADLSGTADVTLPVFFPTQSDYVGDIDYDATFAISGAGGLATTPTLDVDSGFNDLDYGDFSIFDNLSLMLEAGDLFLGGLQDMLDGQVFNFSLPIVGDRISAGADFIERLRVVLVPHFRNLVENTEEETGELIQHFLFAILGPGGDKVTYEVEGIDLIPDSLPGLELLKNLDETDINYGLSSYGTSDVEAAIYYDKDLDGTGGDDFAQWNFVLGQSYSPNINIDFDLGLPALGLDGDVGLNVDIGWTLGLGLGISLMEGAYLDISRLDYSNPLNTDSDPENDTAPIPELDITLSAVLSEQTDISGQLLFLQLLMDNSSTPFDFDLDAGDYLDATPGTDTTQFFAQFTVDIINEGLPTDENLAYSELGGFGVKVGAAADAEVNLDFRLQFNDEILPDTIAALMPAVEANFVFDWQIQTDDFTAGIDLPSGLEYVAFLDVELDLGSFLGDLVVPIVDKIQEVTDPLQPIVDIVTARIPLVSDVAGRTVTLVDLAALFGDINPDLIYAIADIITFVNSIPTEIDNLMLPVGDFVLYGSGIIDDAAKLFDANFDFSDDNVPGFGDKIKDLEMLDDATQLLDAAGNFVGDLGGGQTADFLSDLLGGDYNTETERGEYGFAFPLLENPTSIMGVLVGRPVTLITYDLPPFFMDFTWEQGFPVYPPLNVVVGVGVGLSIDLAFGYDTQGVADFMESYNPLDLLSGLFVSDTDMPDGSGTDVPELVFKGSIGVGAELNLGIASAGVTADVIVTVNFDLFDPDRDGKVRITELVGNFLFELNNGDPEDAPMAIFDVYGDVAMQLSAYIKFLFAQLDFEITPPIVLFEFEIPFERMPILATERGDGALLLNVGPSSGARLNGNTDDIPETISASGSAGNISVWGFGVEEGSPQTYSGNKIIVYGGKGDDVINLEGVSVPVEIHGGGGNDTIYAGSGGSIIYGGLGDDTIYGGSGKDIIFGERGHDTIEGRGGIDYIFGDTGFITDLGGGKERISSLAGAKDGDDALDGGGDNDVMFGGGGDDTIAGGADADLIFGDGGRMTWMAGTIPTASPTPDFYDSNNDGLVISTRGFIGGNDTIYGNTGDDIIFGSKGNDLIDGGADADLLYGHRGFDTIYGGSGADDIYGGREDDIIFGDRDPHGGLFGFAGETTDTDPDGADVIYGEDGNDYIRGNEADDVIYGNRGADIIFGDAEDDTIYGQEGPDIIFGGPDDDIIVADTGNDVVFGDDGAVVYFDFHTAPFVVFIQVGSRIRTTAAGHKIIGDGGGANATDINNLIGGFTDDGNFRTMDLIVTDIKATDGDDIIAGGEADDIVLGGAGHDWIGGDVPVIQTNEDGSPKLFGSGDIQLAGGDWVKLISELPEIRPVGQDVLIGDGGRVEMFERRFSRVATVIDTNSPPLPGNDHIFSDNGADIAFGGTADDVIYGGYRDPLGPVEPVLDENELPIAGQYDDNDILLGDNGVVEYLAGVVERIYTSDEEETTGGADEIYGKEGNDVILGGVNNGGEDNLYGDTETPVYALDARDIILGDNGLIDFAFDGDTDLDTLDLIRSEPYDSTETTVLGGADVISGNQGHDVLIGGTGGDTMYGDNATASAAADDGEDIMLGDNADIFLIGPEGRLMVQVAAMPAGTAVDLITTTDEAEATGGADTMSGNAMADIMLGGVFGDTIYGDRAVPTSTTIADDDDDIILGDNGLLDFTYDPADYPNDDQSVIPDTDRNTLDLIRSFEDGLGGSDTISGNKGLDVAIGGTDGDTIYGDDADASAEDVDLGDLLLGDNADIFLVDPLGASGGDIKLVLDAAVFLIRTTDEEHPEYGGRDTISGNADADIIAGGVEGDTIYGDRLDEDATHLDDGDDIILGDNAAFEWLSGGRFNEISGVDISVENPALYAKYGGAVEDDDLTTLDLVTTEQPTSGGRDYIRGDDGADFVFGGTDLDAIYGDDSDLEDPDVTGGDDLLFGDHGRIYPQFSTLREEGQDWRDGFNSRNFFAIDTGDGDGGAGDRMWGEEGDDSMLGQQGDDRMWGGGDDDDMTGGHNVSGGYDELTGPAINATLNPPVNDLMDGGAGDDAMAGDNAIIWRRGDDNSPRFRELTADAIYTTDAESIAANVETFPSRFDGRSDPDDAVGRDITMLDHDDDVEDTPLGRFGNDVMAGGADSDVMFGELGDDLMQGDGAIEIPPAVGAPFLSHELDVVDTGFVAPDPDTSETLYFNIPELATDADDYMEGNGGSDLMYGGLGQDDMIGGSSALFGLDSEFKRPDVSDFIFGGAGIDIERNDIGDTTFGLASEDPETHVITTEPDGHARDADFIMGDNANVYRLVVGGAFYPVGAAYPAGSQTTLQADSFLTFLFDDIYGLQVIPRAMEQLDYTLGGADYAKDEYPSAEYVDGAADLDGDLGPVPADNGAADLIHGESGDDVIFGMTGSDVIFGEGQDDDVVGGYGHDWISGGTGQDGILGDDGLILTSRNSTDGEPLYGIAGLEDRDPRPKYADGNVLDETIKTPGEIQYAVINLEGLLKKTADLVPFSYDPDWLAMDDEFPDNQDDTPFADDIIFGGLGTDWLHGASGDDAVSGAEALAHAYVPNYAGVGILDLGYDQAGLPANLNVMNPGDVLAFNPVDVDGWHTNNRLRAGEFALYDEYDPRRTILLTPAGELYKETGGTEGVDYFQFLLNFDEDEGRVRPEGEVPKATGQQTETYPEVNDDGKDSIFGDLGNDWLVGGTGRDNIYGGWGNDLLNADDDHDGHGDVNELNDTPDTHPYYEDRAYGGAGRDVLIGNTGGDRLIDWVGEYNSYLVPYAPFGQASVSRTLQPFLPEFLYALSAGDGADPTRPTDVGADPLRNGEPDAEMGLVLQKDFAWQAQTGAPADPQAGNIPGGHRDVLRTAGFNNETSQGFSADIGAWEVKAGRYYVEPEVLGGEAISVWHHDQPLPSYFELTATVSPVKPIAGYKANAYIVFDYYSDEDFKFAGLNSSTNKVEIGRRTVDGWEVLAFANMQIKDGRDYNLLLALNGTTATIVVNNGPTLSYAFAPRLDVYGLPHNFNEGMVGLGADNAKASIDNVSIQILPPVITLTATDTFTDPPVLIAADTGSWSLLDGRFVGTPSAGSSIALATGELHIGPAYLLKLQTTVSTAATGGVIFDQYAADDFKWAAWSKDSDQVMIGHYTARDGWVVDKTVRLRLNGDVELTVTLKGSTVSVLANGKAAVSHVFNAVVTDGGFGLLAKDGSASFDVFTVGTDDPSFEVPPENLMATVAPEVAVAGSDLTDEELSSVVEAAVDRWVETFGIDSVLAAALQGVEFQIVDFEGLILGQAISDTIFIDADAAGYGWYVDDTPTDDVEFSGLGGNGELVADSSSDAFGQMDLLTVVIHELGHVLGFEDLASETDSGELMYHELGAGVRRTEADVALTSIQLENTAFYWRLQDEDDGLLTSALYHLQ